MTMQSITVPLKAGPAFQTRARERLIRRLIKALIEAHMRRVEHEVAEFIRARGWNDQTEREIEQRLLSR